MLKSGCSHACWASYALAPVCTLCREKDKTKVKKGGLLWGHIHYKPCLTNVFNQSVSMTGDEEPFNNPADRPAKQVLIHQHSSIGAGIEYRFKLIAQAGSTLLQRFVLTSICQRKWSVFTWWRISLLGCKCVKTSGMSGSFKISRYHTSWGTSESYKHSQPDWF